MKKLSLSSIDFQQQQLYCKIKRYKVPYIKKFYSHIFRKIKSFIICTIPKINYFMDKIIKRGKGREKINQTNVLYKCI